MTDRRCETCKWWVRLPEGCDALYVTTLKFARADEQPKPVTDYGQCRRMPPRLSERSIQHGKRLMNVTITEFPDTPAAAWCGEWAESNRPIEGRKDAGQAK